MLKSLDLFGFKSFADRVRFDFDPGVTCVVGPNGSGKSNVVDAIKWLLGDQSAKSLRGSEMLDVIFNGSAGRGPSGFSEAVLTFDNSTGLIPFAAREVAVGRRLYRTGESEYLLNGEAVRLKDVRSLFMGTGAGSAAYSIIEQGRVGQILQANPAARTSGLRRSRRRQRSSAPRRAEAERRLGPRCAESGTSDGHRRRDRCPPCRPRAPQASKAAKYRELTKEVAGLLARTGRRSGSPPRRDGSSTIGRGTLEGDETAEADGRRYRTPVRCMAGAKANVCRPHQADAEVPADDGTESAQSTAVGSQSRASPRRSNDWSRCNRISTTAAAESAARASQSERQSEQRRRDARPAGRTGRSTSRSRTAASAAEAEAVRRAGSGR